MFDHGGSFQKIVAKSPRAIRLAEKTNDLPDRGGVLLPPFFCLLAKSYLPTYHF